MILGGLGLAFEEGTATEPSIFGRIGLQCEGFTINNPQEPVQ